MKEKTYKIGEVAEILGVHPDTVRNWENEGLIIPDRIGTRGDRRYTIAHIQEIKDKNLVSTLAKKNNKNKDYSNLSKEELIKEIQILNKQKTFGLVYEDKKEEIVEECKNKAPILKPVLKYRIEDKKADLKKPKHILIQGDNYHALKVLNYTHKNKIDVIYIDPPYNTGNKDFIYNDSFIDKEDSYRHSKWLSFMKHRLVLARELLKDSGVIFISIDDNEQARLKLLCDEIFGEENFISQITWHRKRGKDNSAKFISKTHEYILIYAKNISHAFLNNIELSSETLSQYNNPDNDIRGNYRKLALWRRGGQGGSKAFSFITKEGKTIPPRSWLVNEETMKRLDLEDKLIVIGSNLYRKHFLSEHHGSIPESIWLDVSNTANATDMIKDIFGVSNFDTPKPIELMLRILNISSNKDSIVLDFFAGSGTTGHAVLELNKEDGGHRQVILCTNNENGIAEKVTFERMKRVMKGYENKKKEKVAGLGGELEYFETELVDVENMNRVDDDRKLAFTLEAGWVIATKENTFNEIEKNDSYQIFEGVENIKGKSINKTVAIYFKENLDKLKELENKILKKENVKLYIFSHFTNEFVSEYADYKNVKVCDIPEPILKVYRGFNNS